MSLSNPRILFGMHSITPVRRSDGKPYGIMKVVGTAGIGLTADLEQLFAGSNKFAWAAEAKTFQSEVSMKVKQYPDFLFELFLGATVTATNTDTTGIISEFANVKGSTIKDASNGISGIAIGSGNKAQLKAGRYLIVATAAGTADVFAYSDVDFLRGTDGDFANDLLRVGQIDVSSATDTSMSAAWGLEFTKVGTPAFTVGDTAEFVVAPPAAAGGADIEIGKSGSTIPAFAAYIVAQKRATGEIFTIMAWNVVANGLPINLEENAYSQPEVKLIALYDSTRNGVFKIKAYNPS